MSVDDDGNSLPPLPPPLPPLAKFDAPTIFHDRDELKDEVRRIMQSVSPFPSFTFSMHHGKEAGSWVYKIQFVHEDTIAKSFKKCSTSESKSKSKSSSRSNSVSGTASGTASDSGADAGTIPAKIVPTEAVATEATPTEEATKVTTTEVTSIELTSSEANSTEATPTEATLTEAVPTETTPTETALTVATLDDDLPVLHMTIIDFGGDESGTKPDRDLLGVEETETRNPIRAAVMKDIWDAVDPLDIPRGHHQFYTIYDLEKAKGYDSIDADSVYYMKWSTNEIIWSLSNDGVVKAICCSSGLEDLWYEEVIRDLSGHGDRCCHPMNFAATICAQLYYGLRCETYSKMRDLYGVKNKIGLYGSHFGHWRDFSHRLRTNDPTELSRITSGIFDRLCSLVDSCSRLQESTEWIQHGCDKVKRLPSSAMNEDDWSKTSSRVSQRAADSSVEMIRMHKEYKTLQQKATIQFQVLSNLIAQSDARQNLAIATGMRKQAEDSRRIAEATMRDSASMKAIAAVTMFFLPGTYLSSLFAIPIFHWSTPTDSRVMSSQIWVYFAFMIPLTILTVIIWLAWDAFVNKRLEKENRKHEEMKQNITPANLDDSLTDPPDSAMLEKSPLPSVRAPSRAGSVHTINSVRSGRSGRSIRSVRSIRSIKPLSTRMPTNEFNDPIMRKAPNFVFTDKLSMSSKRSLPRRQSRIDELSPV